MWHSYKQMILTTGLLAAIQGGCAANQPSPPTASTKTTAAFAVHSECLVCKKNADLACVDVDVDNKTLFLDFSGRRYYFCSDECRSEFQKNPAKFVAVK